MDSPSTYSSSVKGARFVSKVKKDFDVCEFICSWRFNDPEKLVCGDVLV